MSEFGFAGGGQAPHEKESTDEHFKEVEEDIRHDREAEQVAKAHRRRTRWKFWGSRHDPPPDHKSSPNAGDGTATRQQPPHQPPPGPGTIGTGV